MFPLFFLLDAACVDTSLMMGVSRFPVYFLGMYLGAEAADGKQPTRRHLIISGLLLVGSMAAYYVLVTRFPGSLKRYGFWWHPFRCLPRLSVSDDLAAGKAGALGGNPYT